MNGITLESVESAFCEWRAQRIRRTEATPEYLWVMAERLYPEYKRSKICHQLRLSTRKFNSRLKNRDCAPSDKGFVLASREEVKVHCPPSFDVHLVASFVMIKFNICKFFNHLLDAYQPKADGVYYIFQIIIN